MSDRKFVLKEETRGSSDRVLAMDEDLEEVLKIGGEKAGLKLDFGGLFDE